MTLVWHMLQRGQKLTARLPIGHCILFAAIAIIFAAPAASSTLRNVTITVPEGTSDHGNPRLLCTPAKWTDVATFLLANFVAHAATVRTQPGEPVVSVISVVISALCFPSSGTGRGLEAILRHAVTGDSPLQMAKKAGALCQVVRTSDWKPRSEDVVRGVHVTQSSFPRNRSMELDDVSNAWSHVSHPIDNRIDSTANRELSDTVDTGNSMILESAIPSPTASPPVDSSRVPSHVLHIDDLLYGHTFEPSRRTFTLEGRKVHGICQLPHGFALAPVASTATVAELDYTRSDHGKPQVNPRRNTAVEISSSYSLAQGLVAVFQTLYASVTLYRARGDQIDRYGYAAFGLTVAPYLVMSLVNLVGTVLTPNYPTIYMVESEIMREAARREGARFHGVVGMIENVSFPFWRIDIVFEIDERGRSLAQQHRSNSSTTAYINTLTGTEEAMEVSRERWLIDLNPSINDRKTKPRVLVPAYGYYPEDDDTKDMLNFYLTLLVGLTSLAINGILTHFKAGNSTHAQRVWTMTWLAFGIFHGTSFYLSAKISNSPFRELLAMVFVYSAVAIGGLVVVCQMLLNYGNCVQIY